MTVPPEDQADRERDVGGTLRFETVGDLPSLAALGEWWDGLVRAMPRTSPFLLHGWLTEWWRHFGEGKQLAVQTAYRGDTLVAALPTFVRRRRGLRVAEFLGAHESALADVLLADGEPPSTAAGLADGLVASRIDYADLFGLPGASRLARALRPSRLRLVMRTEAPVLDLNGGWEAVYAARTRSQTRNQHRRRRRQLAQLGAVTIDVARTADELAEVLEHAFRLHALRRAGRPDDSTFNTPVGMRFHRAALAAVAPAGVARILTLKVDGRPIAFHYFFILNRAMYVHRLGFEPELARFSPGLIATLASIEAASEEGVEKVEFLGGTERYKTDLSDRIDPLHQGLGLTSSLAGRVFVSAEWARIALRSRLKRWEALRRLYHEGLAPARRAFSALRRARVSSSGAGRDR